VLVCIRKATSDHYIAKRRSNTNSAVKQENDLHVGHDGSCFFAASITPRLLSKHTPVCAPRCVMAVTTGCSRISASSDGVKFFLYGFLFMLQWPVCGRKLEMQGEVPGKQAPTSANKLIMMRAAIIDSLLVWTA